MFSIMFHLRVYLFQFHNIDKCFTLVRNMKTEILRTPTYRTEVFYYKCRDCKEFKSYDTRVSQVHQIQTGHRVYVSKFFKILGRSKIRINDVNGLEELEKN